MGSERLLVPVRLQRANNAYSNSKFEIQIIKDERGHRAFETFRTEMKLVQVDCENIQKSALSLKNLNFIDVLIQILSNFSYRQS